MSQILLCLIGCVFIINSLSAQDYTVQFLKGPRQFESNISEFTGMHQVQANEIFNQRFYRFVQFNAVPTASQKAALANHGIRLLEYIPNMLYVASIPTSVNFNAWDDLNIRSIMPIERQYKMTQRLLDKDYPSWSRVGKHIMVNIQYYQDVDATTAMTAMHKHGLEVMEAMHHAQIIVAKLPVSELEALADASFIRYVDIVPEPGKPESDDGRHLHRANAIDGDYYGARDYDGTGITIAINDDGFVGPHIDFQGRVNQQDVDGDFTGDHGDMTAGIAGGAGNLNPLIRGMATGAYMHIRQYSGNLGGTIPLHVDSSVLVFNSSYSNGCNAGYTNRARLVDQEIYTYPTLMQTFSAGNDNGSNCGYGAGNQWGNITGGHKMGKNVIATANINENDIILSHSSRGPASDGRIKPDISAHGNDQMSTDPNNTYAPGGGTSAAAPGICGVMAQLHQAYSELNSGTTAPSGLLKVAMLATANDLGNDGPDFIYGWGKINALRAVKVLEENRYLSATVAQGGSNTHNITIPAGVKRAKIMVYWVDNEGSTSASTALVNDLDCTVSDPSAGTHLPWLLNHTPNATLLAQPATKGADHLNNMEQIAIDNPAAGTYTLNVSGTTVPFGPQEYFVVYEFLTDEITVIHPMGGEGIIAGSSTRIHWDAYDNSGTFDIELSVDGGVTWGVIAANVSGSSRFRNWTAPSTVTGQARIRVKRGANSGESVTNFTVISRPNNIHVTRICPTLSAIQIAWDVVPGAVGYDVYVLGQKYMDSVGTTTDLFFNVPVNDIYAPQWFSVRAIAPNNGRGLRQNAVYFDGNPSDCYLTCVSDDDAGVATIDYPLGGLEVCNGLSNVPVTVSLENIGLITETNFPVSYQLDNGNIITETFTDTLLAGGTASFTFSTGIPVPAAGNYTLKVWTDLTNDHTTCNDTVIQPIQALTPISSFPYTEDFQATSFPPTNAYINNPDNDATWEQSTGLVFGSDGAFTRALRMPNFGYEGLGELDIFSLASMDLTSVVSAELSFDVAYRLYQFRADLLEVQISTDCGATFTSIYSKSGFQLATGGTVTTAFAPWSANDWRNEVLDLTPYVGNHVTLRFVNRSARGNNLFIDNINVTLGAAVGVEQLENKLAWTVLPNPTNGEVTLQLQKALTEDLNVEVVGMDGKSLFTTTLSAGKVEEQLDLSTFPAAVYLIRLSNSELVDIRKVIVK